jgi:hypothetical protein
MRVLAVSAMNMSPVVSLKATLIGWRSAPLERPR